MIWLLTTLAALAAAFYIAAPFYRESSLRTPAGAPLRARQRELETRREGLLRELKELELDRRMGKVDADQYALSRSRATKEAAHVLRQLEELRTPGAARAQRRERAATPETSRVSVAKAAPANSHLDLEIELEVAVARARRQKTLRAATWACSCGRVMQASDLFCASCGQAKPADVAQAQTSAL